MFFFLIGEKEGKLTEEAEFDGLEQSWLELASSLDWNYEGNSIRALYQFEILTEKVAYTLLSTLDSMKALYLRDNFHYKMSSLPWPIGIFRKLEIELPYDPEIPPLGIHTEETRIERDTCTPMFIAALFIIARTWKQPRCPSADEWIRKLWYIYTMEYCSAIKKNTFESVLMRWMKLEPIIQSEVSQKEKHQYSILTHIYGI